MDTAYAFLLVALANLQDAQNAVRTAKQYTCINLSHADDKIFSAIRQVHLSISEHYDDIEQARKEALTHERQ